MSLDRNISRMYWYFNPRLGLNFGDWIGPFLYRELRGHGPVFTDQLTRGSSGVFFSCGSILHKISEPNRAIVWGSGAIEEETRFEAPREIRSVRGPLSRQLCLDQGFDCPSVYGDPGLLLPEFYSPERGRNRWRLGLVPHYVDFDELSQNYAGQPDVKIIDVRRNVKEVVDDIVCCDSVVSTSLHGVIVSLAYRVPTLWARLSDRIIGGNFKFFDFYLGVGIDPPPDPFPLASCPSIERLILEAARAPSLPVGFSCNEILSCCPFLA